MTDEREPKWLFETAYEPYATAIGYLVREWNYLQNKFCDLFCTIMEPTAYEVASAVWYAVQNDRLQRSLLIAAASKRLAPEHGPKNKNLLKGIKWGVCKANGLGSQRDDTIHSPVTMLLEDPIRFVSMYFHGNPRAMNLKGKDLLDEFELYRQNAVILKNYLSQLEYCLRLWLRGTPTDMQPPSPEKPQLLTFPKKNEGDNSVTKISSPDAAATR
jgi:hypothetical protein